jgi:hypothetical protein
LIDINHRAACHTIETPKEATGRSQKTGWRLFSLFAAVFAAWARQLSHSQAN